MTWTWLQGLLLRRRGRLVAVTAGVGVAVALLASLGSFLAAAKASMTAQAVRAVAVDWQVAVAPGVDPAGVLAATRAEPGTRAALSVGYATSGGLTASTVPDPTAGAPPAASTQTTGTAQVLGLPPGYTTTFPGEVRPLSGMSTLTPGAKPGGEPAPALLAQQTASNLAAHVGDIVSVARAGLAPLSVRVAGVVDLPQVDSLFQAVGAPVGSQPSAPPDNVVLLDTAVWHAVFDPLAAARPDLVGTQVHAGRDRMLLPADPASAYTQAVGQAHHLEARLAGAGKVGNNLAATLDTARKDALYAQVLFVFLGVPGAVLAAALTATVAAAGATRRRREQALLRLRGAQPSQVLRMAAAEAGVVGVLGSALGLAVAAGIGRASFGSGSFGATGRAAAAWLAGSVVVGLAVAMLAVLLPARRDLRAGSVLAGRQATARAARDTRPPLALRLGLDLLLLLGAAAVYAVTSRDGYSLVLAPEGVASISVSYWAFAGPAMLWVGAALATWRCVDLLLRRGRRLLERLARPLSGRLGGLAAASASRQRGLLARASVLAGLSVAFAISTAVFNSTYQAQAAVDARLTNGADIAVTAPPGTQVAPNLVSRLGSIAGVRSVEPLLHRYAYIGADLQDLYGVRPATIGSATSLQDAYFTGGSATALIATLGTHPDAILVSSETVKDYQLRLGDPLTLRLQDTRNQSTVAVVFHYAGVAKEFPTAPHDSFFVTNSEYVARATHNPAVGTFLLATGGDPGATADRVRAMLGPGGAVVTDVTTTRTAVGSSLTAVDLAGLTRVELAFALVLAVASGGLVLGLGLAERRRDLAVVAALGASVRQLRALVHVDSALVTVAALVSGVVTGALLSQVLVKVLAGVFDPAPAGLVAPWPYLALVVGLTVAGVSAASWLVSLRASQGVPAHLREL